MISPPSATSNVVAQHCIGVLVTDALGNGVSGVTVLVTISGAVNLSGVLTTDANGEAVFCYTGPAFPGADDIMVHVDTDGDGSIDSGEPVANATNTWLLPEATPGQVTGGGHVPHAETSNEIAFGFNARSDNDRLIGHCNVVDQANAVHLRCVDVTALVRDGSRETVYGTATVNGVATIYRIDVEDLAEPGASYDTFRIVTASGYAAGGVLTRGNVQVR